VFLHVSLSLAKCFLLNMRRSKIFLLDFRDPCTGFRCGHICKHELSTTSIRREREVDEVGTSGWEVKLGPKLGPKLG
jgi:hypothetical protein